MKSRKRLLTATMTITLLTSLHINAQERPADTLSEDIMEMDNKLFAEAFNKCNLSLFKTIVSSDLEFYDDRSGLNTSFAKEVAAFKDRCSKQEKVTRKLVEAEVSRLGDYGAVEIGKHDFYVDNVKVESARFIIIWERTSESWVMKRTVSFNHQPASGDDT